MRRLISLAVFVLTTSPVFAGTIYVDQSLTTGLDDGSSWANAYRSANCLKTGILLASPGDQVFVKQGTYSPSITGERWMSFELREGVEVYGGFAGGESSPSERPAFGLAPTILSGDLNGDDDLGGLYDNSYNVVYAKSVSRASVLDGFVITGGVANGPTTNSSDEYGSGAGLHCVSGGSPTIRKCLFTGNLADRTGGGCFAFDSAPLLIDCQFELNEAYGGGGLSLELSSGTRVERCSFRHNVAKVGGALTTNLAGATEITNSLFEANTATGFGGGGAMKFYNSFGARVSCCTIVGNQCTSDEKGGLTAQTGVVILNNNIVWGNLGQDGAHDTENQISSGFVTTYCLVEGGIGGTGNIAGPPGFVDAANGDYRLQFGSPGVDAGTNAGLPGDVTTDFAGQPRFVDDGATPDTGFGSAPIVDMGIHEAPNLLHVSALCFGDGSGTACPCSNPGTSGNGCANGAYNAGARLGFSGVPSVASDSFVLQVTAATPQQPGLFFLGDQVLSGGLGQVFGDGLRCAGGSVLRLEVATADTFGDLYSSISISQSATLSPGETTFIQFWYRDPLGSPCGTGFNLTNALEAFWIP